MGLSEKIRKECESWRACGIVGFFLASPYGERVHSEKMGGMGRKRGAADSPESTRFRYRCPHSPYNWCYWSGFHWFVSESAKNLSIIIHKKSMKTTNLLSSDHEPIFHHRYHRLIVYEMKHVSPVFFFLSCPIISKM